jgi:hypothetical protein
MITVTTLVQTCNACPTQWEGATTDGRTIYVRFRWGYLTIGLGNTLDEAVDDLTFDVAFGDNLLGVLSFDQLKTITAGHFVWPKVDA